MALLLREETLWLERNIQLKEEKEKKQKTLFTDSWWKEEEKKTKEGWFFFLVAKIKEACSKPKHLNPAAVYANYA